MKNSKGTKRLVSGIPRANEGCQHFAFSISHFSELISEPRVNQKRAFSVEEMSSDYASAVRLCHPLELPNARILPLCGSGHLAASQIRR
jgi:hypothetical protein